jgi:hypothetical protein
MWNREYSKLNWRAANVCVEGGGSYGIRGNSGSWNVHVRDIRGCRSGRRWWCEGKAKKAQGRTKRVFPLFFLPSSSSPLPFPPSFASSSICPSSQFPLPITRTSGSRISQANLVVMAVRSLCILTFFFPPPFLVPFRCCFFVLGGGMGEGWARARVRWFRCDLVLRCLWCCECLWFDGVARS